VYGGLTSEERRRARRSALLDAAFDLFGTAGYGATGIERLCTHARLATRNFYEEFPDREALLRAVYDGAITHVMDAVLATLATAGPTVRERVDAAVRSMVHAMLDDPRRASIVCLQVVGVSDALERHRRGVMRAFADVVVDEAAVLATTGGVARRRDYRLPALALVGGVNELMVDWLQTDDPLPVDTLADEVVNLFLAAAAGPPDHPFRQGL
jgi:AcrR family transcriptional regulator